MILYPNRILVESCLFLNQDPVGSYRILLRIQQNPIRILIRILQDLVQDPIRILLGSCLGSYRILYRILCRIL